MARAPPEPMTTAIEAGSEIMSRRRQMFLSALFLVLIAGQLFDIVLKREDWPFSNYPMYSGVRRNTISREEIVGVTTKGEITLNPGKHFAPLDNTRFQRVLSKLRRKSRSAAYKEALRELFQRYEDLRIKGVHHDPPLLALRSYRIGWTLKSGATNKDTPDERELRFYVHSPPAAAIDRLTREVAGKLTEADLAARKRVASEDIVVGARDFETFGRARLVTAEYASERRAILLNARARSEPPAEPSGHAEIELPTARGEYEIWMRASSKGRAPSDSLWVQAVQGGTVTCPPSIRGMGNWSDAFPADAFAWSSSAPGAPACTVTVTQAPLRLRISGRDGRMLLDQLWLRSQALEAPDFAEPVTRKGKGKKGP